MLKIKKWFMNHNWSLGSILIAIFFILFVIAMIFNVIVTIKYGGKRERNAFTNDDINYMISEIENKYGNGQKFIMVNGFSNPIEEDNGPKIWSDVQGSRDKKYIGERYGIIGYFENQDKGYYFSFSRYISNSPYENGNNVIIMTHIDSQIDIENYL